MRLVADANVLLSAVIGGRAALALRHDKVEQVLTPAAAYDEVFEYLPSLAKKKRLELDTLLLAYAALPVTLVERPEYQQKLPTASLMRLTLLDIWRFCRESCRRPLSR